ncbi:SdpI family protein [Bifidobacterium xylocopae]|uniref:SdpI/YhfL protein family n=1 Tax=Bifidobacterium xylocopae TaxID=2493119 RepID=A0A366KE74_9BIFI|nr:SdpI family protein [Bifidobacterium xylocopae]RBP98971.1 hypothetical protein CRD59_06170 [Bifidobacterium xylocopae]
MPFRSAPASSLDASRLLCGLMGLCFIVLGNFMPRVKPNHVFGTRLPGDYVSRGSWRRVQRAGGWSFIALCALTLLAALTIDGVRVLAALMAGLLLTGFFLVPYSAYGGRKYADMGGPI